MPDKESTPCNVTLEMVREAAKRIHPYVHRTAVSTCRTINRIAGCELFFKCEQLQKVGAFKFRGACNAVMKLSDAEAQRGVLTHSSGNHAQALALAANLRGIRAHVVMPEDSSIVKRQAVEDYGAVVVTCAPVLAARESTAAEVQRTTGATFIPPYDHVDIIAGQGTAALELLEDVPGLDAVVTPVGGGGLISGTCVVVDALTPSTRVFAGEPLGADDAAQSKQAGVLVPQTSPNTIADGLRTSLGELTWPYVRDYVEDVVTVDEDQIVHAMRLLWERAKLLVEPSASVALAAVLDDRFRQSKRFNRIGVILSGGNIDLNHLPW